MKYWQRLGIIYVRKKVRLYCQNFNRLERIPLADTEKEKKKIKITMDGGLGEIELELYPEAAPITVANFVDLVGQGFYDGLTFHRIISGFMIQGGDPLGNGMGGSKNKIKGEFRQNGVDNPIKHTRGVISMARSMMPNSASSQFFIMHEDAPHLDGAYAAFGKVISGMDTVDKIASTKVGFDGQTPVVAPVILKMELI